MATVALKNCIKVVLELPTDRVISRPFWLLDCQVPIRPFLVLARYNNFPLCLLLCSLVLVELGLPTRRALVFSGSYYNPIKFLPI